MQIEADLTPELERDLERRAPWMHPYRIGGDAIVGRFKYHGLADQTVATGATDPELRVRLAAAYAAYERGEPGWQIRELARRLDGLAGATCLDIASASGRFSFHLAANGAADVLGVEIREEQVEQAELLRSIDTSGRFESVRFEHDPTSADDEQFRGGESYDVVLSMGLLYHLERPLQHLANLRRLARRAAVVHTATHAERPGYWQLNAEARREITKATSGVSWTPHFADVPQLLRRAGFGRVEVLATPRVAALQAWDVRDTRLQRLLLPGAAFAALERRRARRYVASFRQAQLEGINARYYCYLALV